MSKMAKRVAIIMVMPSPIPMLGGPIVDAMDIRQHPPIPAPPHVVMPAPLPPPILTPPGVPVPTLSSPVIPPQAVAFPAPPPPVCCPCPAVAGDTAFPVLKTNTGIETCLQLMGMASDLCSITHTPNLPYLCASALGLLMDLCPATCCVPTSPRYVEHPPQYIPPSPPFPMPRELNAQEAAVTIPPACGLCGNFASVGQPTVVSCSVVAPMTATKLHITAMPSSDELEMKVGVDTCIRCKKMTVKIGENEMTLSRFDDRVRVRGEELKATAGSVRSDCKDVLILEGDVMLHYKNGVHYANVSGDRIELNLCSGAVTIKPIAKSRFAPSVSIGKK
jgi:hypothetical protein